MRLSKARYKQKHSPGAEVGYANGVEDVAEDLEQHDKEEPHERKRAVLPVVGTHTHTQTGDQWGVREEGGE